MSDQLEEIQEDVRDIKRWIERHETAHSDDTRLLASIVDTLSTHQSNHHGPPHPLVLARNGGIVAVISGAIIIVAEVIRYIAL